MFAYIGRLDLFPSSDDWVDTRRAPDKVVNLEGDFTAQVQRFGGDTNTGFVPTQWNSWRTTWTGEEASGETNRRRTRRRNQWGGGLAIMADFTITSTTCLLYTSPSPRD